MGETTDTNVENFGGWRFAFSKSYSGWVHSTDIPGIPADEAEAQEFAASELAAFSAVSHEHPELLQAYIIFADHIAVDILSLTPLCQPPDIWAALDVTSRNFLSLVKAQPGYFAATSGHQFEAVVAQIFRNNGFEVIQTKQSRDGGYDLRLVVPLFSKLKASYLVECKNPRKGRIIVVDVVRGLKGGPTMSATTRRAVSWWQAQPSLQTLKRRQERPDGQSR